ncbi:Ger(x)C family spore germination protein [Clostridium swellfunianum]|uniref:Ger(x)C family spore germination protein n=1 Tax=Clostridium swellfunianum TaxID=1367462 RepID=UPI00203093B5|nr:Ger(x)C family spore germination protein [Clostridium swellfunianum]MCM0647863.1 Ger(x)C family spore germination protein [Clostridium swellfunianum]
MKNFAKYFKRTVIYLLIIIFVINLTGCTGKRKDIQRLFLVLAVGIDLMPDNKLEVTMQILNPNVPTSQSGSSSGSSGKDIIIISGVGYTLFDAVFEASKTMSRAQHFGHVKYIVVGDSLARNGIKDVFDSIIRIQEFRLNTPFLVTKGKASEIVKAQTSKSPIPSIVIENLFLRQKDVGYRPFSYVIDVQNSLTNPTSAAVAAVINTKRGSEDSLDMNFELAGTAVFKKDKLIGYLNIKETRGLSWIMGTVKVGNITFPADNFGIVSAEILRGSSKIKPIIDENGISLQVNVKVFTDLRQLPNPADPVKNPEVLDQIGIFQSKAVKDEIELVLNMAKGQYKADIFGFGESIHKSYPKIWKSIKKDWDTIYENLNVIINVESIVRSAGLNNKSATEEE